MRLQRVPPEFGAAYRQPRSGMVCFLKYLAALGEHPVTQCGYANRHGVGVVAPMYESQQTSMLSA